MRSFFPLLFLILIFTNCKNDKPQPSEAAQKKIEAGLDTLTGAPKRTENQYTEDGCGLLPDEQFQQIFGINPATEANKRTFKNESFCLWVWKRKDWKERESHNDKGGSYLNPECQLALKMVNYGLATDAAAQFAGKKTGESVAQTGIGENAMWQPSSNTLIFQKRAYNIYLTVEISDTADDNLLKAKEVAAKILTNMTK